MQQSTKCCLCKYPSLEYKYLLDDSGQVNGVYQIAVKYFDPMLLYPGNDRTSKVICMECWRHITDFYTYQQSVINAQSQLEEVQPFVDVDKLEDEIPKTLRSQLSTSPEAINSKPLSPPACSKNRIVDEDTLTSVKQEGDILNNQRPIATTSKNEVNENLSQTPHKQNSDLNDSNQEDITNNGRPSPYVEKLLSYDAFIKKYKGDLECPKCSNEFFESFILLNNHFKTEHPTDKPYAMCCNLRHMSRSQIYKHVLLHANPNVYQCSICERKFKTNWSLQFHKRNVHDNSTSSAKHGARTKKQYRIEVDEIIAKKIGHLECFVCRKTFPTFHLLSLHFKLKHKDREFYINCCGRKLSVRNVILKHIREEHNAEIKRIVEKDNNTNSLYKCTSCSEEFSKYVESKKHICKMAMNKEYNCDKCSAVYKKEGFLRAHYRKNHEYPLSEYSSSEKYKTTNNSNQLLKEFTGALQLVPRVNDQLIDIKHEYPQCSTNLASNNNNNDHRQFMENEKYVKKESCNDSVIQIPSLDIIDIKEEVEVEEDEYHNISTRYIISSL